MKVSKKAKKLAKEIIFASKEKGTTSEEKLKKFTKILVDSKEPIASEILSEIVKTYEKELESSVLKVESAYSLEQTQVDNIKNHFEKITGKKLSLETSINKALIAGIKITLGDNVWENSIESNLEILKGSFV